MSDAKKRISILRTAGVIGVATFASRVTGMIRDMVTASFFGTGYVWDAFVVAYRIPNLFRRLFGDGALSGSVVPVVTEYLARRGNADTNRLTNNIIAVLGLFLLGLTGVLLIVLGALLAFTPDLSDRMALVYKLTAVMAPFLFLICLSGMMMGVLNALHHFFVPAFSTVILNCVLIATVWFVCPLIDGAKTDQIYAVAWAIVLAGVLQLAAHFYMYRRLGMDWKWVFDLADEGIHRLLRLMGPSVLGLSITQLNILISSFMAVSLGAGAVSALYYGDRLMEFPQGLFGISIATAALPAMSRRAAENDRPGLLRLLHYSLNLCLLVMVPATAGFLSLSVPIVRLIFEHGHFTAVSTVNTAWALEFYALGLFAFAGARVLTQAFYSVQDTRTPVKIGMVAVLSNLALNFILMHYLYHAGLAFANSLSSLLNFYLLLRFCGRKVGPVDYRGLGVVLGKALAVSAVMGFAVRWVYDVIAGWTGTATLTGQIVSLGAAMGCGMALVFALYLALGVSEAREFLRKLSAKLFPRPSAGA